VDGKRYLIGVGNVRLLGELEKIGTAAGNGQAGVTAAEEIETAAKDEQAKETTRTGETSGTGSDDIQTDKTFETGKNDEPIGKKSIFTRSEKMPLGEAFKIVLAEKLSAKNEDE
jgi:hypothetical protein